MSFSRYVKWAVCLALSGVILLVWWTRPRPGNEPGNAAGGSSRPAPAVSQLMPSNRAAREDLLKREIAQSYRLASAARGPEAMQRIDQLIASWRAVPRSAATSPASRPGPNPRESNTAAERDRIVLELDGRVLEMIKLDLRLTAGEWSEAQWEQSCAAILASDADLAGHLMERTLLMAGQHWTADKSQKLLDSQLPASARAILAMHLAAYRAPAEPADVPQCSRFYETLIARTLDTPAAEALLERYVQELDKRNAHEVANRYLWQLVDLLPASRMGARAAALLLATPTEESRASITQSLLQSHPNTPLASFLIGSELERLARDRRFAERFQLCDADRTLSLAPDRRQFLTALANLATRRPPVDRLAFAHRRSAPPECNAGLPEISPAELCAGLIEEVTGQSVDVSGVKAEPQPTTRPSTDGPTQASLVAFLDRALDPKATDQLRQALRGELGAPRLLPMAHRPVSPSAQRAYEAAWQLSGLAAASKTAEAAQLCHRVLRDPAVDRECALQIRRQLVELLLKEPASDEAELDTQLAALRSQEGSLTASTWNLAWRALFRRVLRAAPPARQTIWMAALADLGEQPWPMTDQTRLDLAQFLSALDADGTLSASAAAADLLLLARDTQSMSDLQLRRMALLQKAKSWAEWTQAARLHVLLATFSSEGSFDAALHDLTTARSAGVPSEWVEQLERGLLPAGSLDRGEADTHPATAWSDDRLQQAAASLLQNAPKLSPRSHAIAQFFAGNPEPAFRGLHALLNQARTTEEALDRWDDIACLLAIADNSPHNPHRFTQWIVESGSPSPPPMISTRPTAGRPMEILLDCEQSSTSRAADNLRTVDPPLSAAKQTPPYRTLGEAPAAVRRELANAALRRWGSQAIAWGRRALARGDVRTAQLAWAAALNAQRRPGSAAALSAIILRDLLDVPSTLEPQERLKVVQAVLPRLRHEQNQRVLQSRIATLHRQVEFSAAKASFEEGSYAECLAALDELDRAWPPPEGLADIEQGFLRVLCLIRLEKLNEAADLLGKMESWPGSAEQQARVLFLTGWIHLQTDNPAKAAAAFQRLIITYAQTSFAEKARNLLANLE